jgi:hypothetical protein
MSEGDSNAHAKRMAAMIFVGLAYVLFTLGALAAACGLWRH